MQENDLFWLQTPWTSRGHFQALALPICTSRAAKNKGSTHFCISRHFLIPIQGPGKVLEISISSDWLQSCPCASPALGSSVALGFHYCSDLLCTLCQNLYILYFLYFNSNKCLYVVSTGISGTVIYHLFIFDFGLQGVPVAILFFIDVELDLFSHVH